MLSKQKSTSILFAENTQIMRQGFFWENSLIYPLCSLIYTSKNLKIDITKIKEADGIIKSNMGMFSSFRGVGRLALATLLSLEENPDKFFVDVRNVYELLRKEFKTSSFLPFTAFLIAKDAQIDEYEKIICKTKEMYNLMKSNHPFLTSGEDTAFATLFAMSPAENRDISSNIEECYKLLKKEFYMADAVQSLSHVLAFSPEKPEEKCNKVFDIYNKMKNYDIKFGRGYELPILGIMALNLIDIEKVIYDIDEIQQFLKPQKGFGFFGIGTKQRIMYSAVLASQLQMTSYENAYETAVINSVTSLIIAQQAAMIAIIAATSASAASASAASS